MTFTGTTSPAAPDRFPADGERMTYDQKLVLYEKLVATNPDVKRKGDTMPYTSLNGNMFSLLTKEGTLILRLDSETQAAFLKKYKSKLPVQYGAVMKEYVEVPDALLAKTRELKKYFDLSYAYASSLKPKPTKKTK
jgi:TfoX/Sxy family transcriptional regulator of competence genes